MACSLDPGVKGPVDSLGHLRDACLNLISVFVLVPSHSSRGDQDGLLNWANTQSTGNILIHFM